MPMRLSRQVASVSIGSSIGIISAKLLKLRHYRRAGPRRAGPRFERAQGGGGRVLSKGFSPRRRRSEAVDAVLMSPSRAKLPAPVVPYLSTGA